MSARPRFEDRVCFVERAAMLRVQTRVVIVVLTAREQLAQGLCPIVGQS
jgi:hypothetical protein